MAIEGERSDNAFLGRLWATRRVGYLLEQVRLNGENRELKDEIIQLGTRYGIVTPYTSFLVTEDLKDIGRRNMPIEERRTLDTMAQMAAPGSGGGGMGDGSRGHRAESAVVYSKAESKMKQSDKIESPETYFTSVRTVGIRPKAGLSRGRTPNGGRSEKPQALRWRRAACCRRDKLNTRRNHLDAILRGRAPL